MWQGAGMVFCAPYLNTASRQQHLTALIQLIPYIMNMDKVIQCPDSLGRISNGIVIDFDKQSSLYTVNFIGWRSEYNVQVNKEDIRKEIQPFGDNFKGEYLNKQI